MYFFVELSTPGTHLQTKINKANTGIMVWICKCKTIP